MFSEESRNFDDPNRTTPRVSSVCQPAGQPPGVKDYDLLPLYIDGNPLVLQGMVKAGILNAQAGSHGHVVIKGDPIPNAQWFPASALPVFYPAPPTAAYDFSTILVVGHPGYGRIVANDEIFSSIEVKKDVVRLSATDYADVLQKLDQLTVARYRYKSWPSELPKEIGFIAEEAPDEIHFGDGIELHRSYGYLLATVKALQLEQQRLKRRVERLK
jgi:hypothetical protein